MRMFGKMMTSSQRNYLRKQAHSLKPVVTVGKMGLDQRIFSALDEALNDHELVKVRFQDFKEQSKELANELAESVVAELVTVIGHIAIIYRPSNDKTKQKIKI